MGELGSHDAVSKHPYIYKTQTRWLIVGSLLAICATGFYFGSDDWEGSARLIGAGVAWLSYLVGLWAFIIYLTRLKGKQLVVAIVILMGCIGGLYYWANVISDWKAYLLMHPYALYVYGWQSEKGIDARILKDWGLRILYPYQMLLELTLILLLVECCLVVGWRFVKARGKKEYAANND